MSEAQFDAADRFAVGAFGAPGQRVFLLQVTQGDRALTVKVEKGQVAEMATHLLQAMADVPEVERVEYAEAATLAVFADPEWAVGSIRLGFDATTQRIAVVLEAFQTEDQVGEAEPESALIMISTTQAAALVSEVGELVTAGRPPCPHCGYPLDPSGHVCPKSNGHRPPKL